MHLQSLKPRLGSRTRRVAALATLALFGLAGADAHGATSVSSNWAGYAVTGTAFSSVTGTWVEPKADCAAASSSLSASAFWIGLGGDATDSDALEQAGTEADCGADGVARYSAWTELVPAASERFALTISAGDRIRGTVTVEGTRVRLELDDLTSGKRAIRTLAATSLDTSSAEWIAEAPTVEDGRGGEQLPLTDFGTVTITDARATSAEGTSGTISDGAWTATRIALESAASGPGRFGPFAAASSETVALPGSLSDGGSRFSVVEKTLAAASPGGGGEPPTAFAARAR